VTWIAKHFSENEILGEEFNIYNMDVTQDKVLNREIEHIVKNTAGNMYGLPGKTPFIAVLKLFETTSTHRAFVTKDEENGKVIGVITQSACVHFISKHLSIFDSVKSSIKELDIGQQGKNLQSVSEDSRAIDAFLLMSEHKISGVAVIDSNGKYIDCITAKDLRSILGSDKPSLVPFYSKTKDFIKLKDAKYSGDKSTITDASTLEDAITILVKQKYHRVFVLDTDGKPTGVVTLGDIIKILSKKAHLDVEVHLVHRKNGITQRITSSADIKAISEEEKKSESPKEETEKKEVKEEKKEEKAESKETENKEGSEPTKATENASPLKDSKKKSDKKKKTKEEPSKEEETKEETKEEPKEKSSKPESKEAPKSSKNTKDSQKSSSPSSKGGFFGFFGKKKDEPKKTLSIDIDALHKDTRTQIDASIKANEESQEKKIKEQEQEETKFDSEVDSLKHKNKQLEERIEYLNQTNSKLIKDILNANDEEFDKIKSALI